MAELAKKITLVVREGPAAGVADAEAHFPDAPPDKLGEVGAEIGGVFGQAETGEDFVLGEARCV